MKTILNNTVVKHMRESWNDLGFKDRAQYITAMVLIASGIILAFVAFFMTLAIPSSVLIYIAQAFVAGGSIFGVSIYFRSQLAEVKAESIGKVQDVIENAISRLQKSEE